MQFFDLRLMRGIITIHLARKYIRQPLDRLFLPLAYLIGMDVKPCSDLSNGRLFFERFTRHLCLELCCIPLPLRLAHLGDSSFVHRIFYTLYDCPNSGVHLSILMCYNYIAHCSFTVTPETEGVFTPSVDSSPKAKS